MLAAMTLEELDQAEPRASFAFMTLGGHEVAFEGRSMLLSPPCQSSSVPAFAFAVIETPTDSTPALIANANLTLFSILMLLLLNICYLQGRSIRFFSRLPYCCHR